MKQCWCGCTELANYSDRYWRCKNCATLITKQEIVYDTEKISDNQDFYGKDYWEKKMLCAAQADNLNDLIVLYLKERTIYWLEKFFHYMLPGSGSVLEVGCGLGQFAYLLKLCGYEESAFELSTHICNYIKKNLQINIHCGGLQPQHELVSAIAAFDVLEHVLDPGEFLDTAAASIEENGFLFFQTPVYDEQLTYEEMRQKKPRFEEQLRANEHVYLYSRESVSQLLKKHGFIYVEFMDAFFGNDYDMFFVASRKPIHHYSQAEINRALEQQGAGWLIKAMMELWQENRSYEAELQSLHSQAEDHLRQIVQLTDSLEEKTRDYNRLQEDHGRRQELIESLSRQLEISEANRKERLTTIERLDNRLGESEADRAERLIVIERMKKQLEESEADRAERLVVIERLKKRLEESETDRANRLEQILTLTKMVEQLSQN